MNILTAFYQGDIILISVFCILVLMSVITWCLIILRSVQIWQARRGNRHLETLLGETPWASLPTTVLTENKHAPFMRLYVQAISAKKRYQDQQTGTLSEYLTQAIRKTLAQENRRQEMGLTFLASVGATAPFIGLFGTVWGIYHALVSIGTAGQASIGTVAGPIGEALIATATGLAAAIPAVLAYNAFSRFKRIMAQEMDYFAYDLHAQLLPPRKD